jgi:hypothetical protein
MTLQYKLPNSYRTKNASDKNCREKLNTRLFTFSVSPTVFETVERKRSRIENLNGIKHRTRQNVKLCGYLQTCFYFN